MNLFFQVKMFILYIHFLVDWRRMIMSVFQHIRIAFSEFLFRFIFALCIVFFCGTPSQ